MIKHQYNIYSIIIAKAMLLATSVLLQTWEQQPPRVSAVLLGILCAALLLIQAVAWALTMPFWFTAWAALETCPRNSRCSKSSTAGLLSFKLSTSKRWEQSDAIGVYCIHVCTTYCLQQGCRTSCPPTQSYCFALYRIFCFRSMPEYQPHFRGKTHTAADGIRQFPTTNKHPTSSDECHSDMISHHSIQNLQDLGNYESLMPVSLPCHPFHPLSWHLGLSSSPWRHCSCSSHRPGEGAVTPTLHMRFEWQPLSDLDSKIHWHNDYDVIIVATSSQHIAHLRVHERF